MLTCPHCQVANLASSRFCHSCGSPLVVRSKNKTNLFLILGICALLPCIFCGVLGMIGGLVQPPTTSQVVGDERHPNNQRPAAIAQTATPQPKGLVLVKARWEKGGFGSVGIWHVTIKNESDKQIGDIKYRTIYQSESGNIVSKGGVDALLGKDTIEKVIAPKRTRTFEVNDGFISDEADRADFQIVSWREIPK